MIGKCSICGATIRSRKSKKGTARANFLAAVRRHMWKYHRSTMISRIKTGKQRSADNPTVQDFISALQDAPGRAFKIYQKLQKRDFTVAKQVMDALEHLLPVEVRASWKAVEAIHDTLKQS
ncbi:hypothetical protein ES705_43762 [subsurface metagenome]